MKLPITLKNKSRRKLKKLSFKNYHFGPPKKRVFGLKRKPPKNYVSSCFGSDSALKIIDEQLFFWSVFLKMHKKY